MTFLAESSRNSVSESELRPSLGPIHRIMYCVLFAPHKCVTQFEPGMQQKATVRGSWALKIGECYEAFDSICCTIANV